MRFILLTLASLRVVLAFRRFTIPNWDITEAGNSNLKSLSSPTYDSSSWHHIGARRTVFGGLIEAGVYDAEQLFYSKNLQTTIDYIPYYNSWLYRSEFTLRAGNGSHTFLQTGGITSKADIYLNGHEVANKETQAGAYGGQTYDITEFSQDSNALLIKAYPTDYDKDFALGFVDWNSYPPDNGTGVWRDVYVKQTGPLFMGPLRIVHDYVPGAKSIRVTLKADITNLETSSMTGVVEGTIMDEAFPHRPLSNLKQTLKLAPLETRTATVSTVIDNPKIWWPKQWGGQPLYTAQVGVFAQGLMSDQSDAKNFGIRHITSELNVHNDTIFTVNGYPFQVTGGGYAPDVFLRWDQAKFEIQAQYVLDMGMNTIRLEGKEEHPELYDVADRLGLMTMPGWECCDKWEAWTYNDEVTATLWNENDHRTANMSMRHEAAMLQTHPSVLAFLIGSDFWPSPRASAIYLEALDAFDWPNPVICSAAKRGYVESLGPSGLKMNGPYDWVPPNYWYDGDTLGTAFGFGSELGSGVGTPEIGSLERFLSSSDLEDLWTKPEKGLYHMSTNESSFHTRKIYNKGLYNRYSKPTSLEDYLLKAQIMDYEATRSEFEAYRANWNSNRPATGVIYWMLNNAWPSLHWNQFDYYLHPAGSYFGTKTACRIEHVAYNYVEKTVYIINHSLVAEGARTIDIDLINIAGESIAMKTISVQTVPNTSKKIIAVPGLNSTEDVTFLRLLLSDSEGTVLSRNVYWLSKSLDKLDWDHSTWFYTPISKFADFSALKDLQTASIMVSVGAAASGSSIVTLRNEADVPAFIIRLNLVDGMGKDIVPVVWTDNYVTLWPGEEMKLEVTYDTSLRASVQVSGWNFGAAQTIQIV